MENATRKADFTFYVKELGSQLCACGRPKKKGRSFCWFCWKELPPDLQRRLYQKLFDGYEEAYEDSVNHLRTYVWPG